MLTHLRLRDFVLIDRAELSPAAGFCALTGETGVGKSVLAEALSLLCGARAGPDRVRPGAPRAEIEAVFLLPPDSEARRILSDAGLNDDDGGELIARRVIAPDARSSRAFLNGRAAPLSQMAAVVSALVDICGQHAHHVLRNPAAHGAILDGFAECAELSAQAESLWRKWREAAEALQNAEANSAETKRRREELAFDLSELNGLNFSPDKWTGMNRRLTRLENVEDLAAGCDEAARLLGENNGGAALSKARRILESLAEKDAGLRGPAGLTAAALDAANEAARELDAYAGNLKPDPAAREEAERFVAEAHRLARRHRLPDPAGLGELTATLESEYETLSRGADSAALRKREKEARLALDKVCAKLTAVRTKAAAKFGAEATKRARALAMPEARIEARLTPVEPPRSFGGERTEFLVSTRAEAEFGPLARVASGGELSRIGLALQATAWRARPTPTVIFDEIDAGVGGAAADAVGAALAELGESRQVLCVTHLAQVAARAGAHWRVRAVRRQGGRSAEVERVTDDERVLEIARMLGGEKTTATAKKHAAEMLGR